MIHGPYEDEFHKRACKKSSQSVNGKRKFKYPNQKQKTTTDTNDSFPNSRGWNNEEHIRGIGESVVVMDNS